MISYFEMIVAIVISIWWPILTKWIQFWEWTHLNGGIPKEFYKCVSCMKSISLWEAAKLWPLWPIRFKVAKIMCFEQYVKNDVNLGVGLETLEALTRVNVMVRYVICCHSGSKSLSVSIRSHYRVENRSHPISTCNDLMPKVFSY